FCSRRPHSLAPRLDPARPDFRSIHAGLDRECHRSRRDAAAALERGAKAAAGLGHPLAIVRHESGRWPRDAVAIRAVWLVESPARLQTHQRIQLPARPGNQKREELKMSTETRTKRQTQTSSSSFVLTH